MPFSFTFTPESSVSTSLGSGASAYVVNAGDTLASIAQGAYGDSSLWIDIAQANGLTGDVTLTAGQVLQLPSQAQLNTNNAEDFKPYNAAKATGAINPQLPNPQAASCGAFGDILIAAVVVAVSLVTTGIASGTTGSLLAEVQAGEDAIAAGNVGAAIEGAVAGNVVGQGIEIAAGVQKNFSFDEVLESAVGAAVSAEVGPVLSKIQDSTVAAIATAATANAATQAVGVVLGTQKGFNWTSFAASAAGAGVAAGVNKALEGNSGFMNALPNTGKLVAGAIAGTVGAVTTGVLEGGKIAIQQVATDAFGNALGDEFAQTVQGQNPAGNTGQMGQQMAGGQTAGGQAGGAVISQQPIAPGQTSLDQATGQPGAVPQVAAPAVVPTPGQATDGNANTRFDAETVARAQAQINEYYSSGLASNGGDGDSGYSGPLGIYVSGTRYSTQSTVHPYFDDGVTPVGDAQDGTGMLGTYLTPGQAVPTLAGYTLVNNQHLDDGEADRMVEFLPSTPQPQMLPTQIDPQSVGGVTGNIIAGVLGAGQSLANGLVRQPLYTAVDVAQEVAHLGNELISGQSQPSPRFVSGIGQAIQSGASVGQIATQTLSGIAALPDKIVQDAELGHYYSLGGDIANTAILVTGAAGAAKAVISGVGIVTRGVNAIDGFGAVETATGSTELASPTIERLLPAPAPLEQVGSELIDNLSGPSEPGTAARIGTEAGPRPVVALETEENTAGGVEGGLNGSRLERDFQQVVGNEMAESGPVNAPRGAQGGNSLEELAPVVSEDSDIDPLSNLSPTARTFLDKYQSLYDARYEQLTGQLRSGDLTLPGNLNETTELGNLTDSLVRRDLRTWLSDRGLTEGRGQAIQVNRNLYDPAGTGSYVRPDLYLRDEGVIFDGTIGAPKSLNSTQIQGYIKYAAPRYIIEVAPGRAPRIVYSNLGGEI